MTLFVPGKVFIMGEYSVIDSSTDAIIAPTQRGITLAINQATSYQYKSRLDPYFETDHLEDFIENHPSKITREVFNTFIHEGYHLTFPPTSWEFSSTLDDNQKAYGLGSSGAFRVAVIKGVMSLLNLPDDHDLVFDLAIKSARNDVASYGDLAVSTYQHSMIYKKHTSHSPTKIQRISIPDYVIINSDIKVSSAPFVRAYLRHKEDAFMQTYTHAIQNIIDAFVKKDEKEPLILIKKAQTIYETMAQNLHPDIINPRLEAIINTIHEYGGIAKVSGAGGGDNVLAFFKSHDEEKRFIDHKKKDLIIL